MTITSEMTLKIETTQIWNLRVGAYQTWHTVRASNHSINELTDLTTPSYYTAEEVNKAPHSARLWVGSVMHKDECGQTTYGSYRWYRLTKRGFVFVREECLS